MTDGKRTEMVCTKLTERMALDLLRAASFEDRSISDYLFQLVRYDLYGRVPKMDSVSDKQGTTK